MRGAEKNKGYKAQGVKPPTPARTSDALIGDEEHNGHQKKKNREWVPNPATLDHWVASYDAQGRYGGAI